jgi:hypothetical protein
MQKKVPRQSLAATAKDTPSSFVVVLLLILLNISSERFSEEIENKTKKTVPFRGNTTSCCRQLLFSLSTTPSVSFPGDTSNSGL